MSALGDEAGRLQDAAESCRRLTDRWYEILCNSGTSRQLAPLLLSMVGVIDRQARVIELMAREREVGDGAI